MQSRTRSSSPLPHDVSNADTELRLRVLREAARVCKAGGRVVAIEHGRSPNFATWMLRHVWWFTWVPGNPEAATTRDLQQRGVDVEMRSAGLDVVERHATRWNWIEGFVGIPGTGKMENRNREPRTENWEPVSVAAEQWPVLNSSIPGSLFSILRKPDRLLGRCSRPWERRTGPGPPRSSRGD